MEKLGVMAFLTPGELDAIPLTTVCVFQGRHRDDSRQSESLRAKASEKVVRPKRQRWSEAARDTEMMSKGSGQTD